MNKHIKPVLLATLMTLSAIGFAEEKPRWMSPEAGFIDEPSDTRVERVTETEGEPGYRVYISMPKVDKSIEEVLVIGQKQEQPPAGKPRFRFEVVDHDDDERSGIILYLGKKQKFALRINYRDGSEQMLPASDDPFDGINR